jgi:hypothetical protein
VAYILSANIHRRNMSKGQRAMVVAKMRPFSGQTLRQLSGQTDLSRGLVGNAAVVLKYASDLADQVVSGSLSLDKAYEEARIRKGRAETHESRFNALKAAASDLADRVVEGQLPLEEAEAALRERQDRVHRNKVLLAEALHDLARHAYLLEYEVQQEEVATFVISEAELYKEWNPDPIDEALHALEVFAEYAGPLLARIAQLKAEREDVEKS